LTTEYWESLIGFLCFYLEQGFLIAIDQHLLPDKETSFLCRLLHLS